jgi:YHS domain.
MFRSLLTTLLAGGILLALPGCASVDPGSSASRLLPANTATVEGQDSVLLAGADVVAYFTEGAFRQGNPAIRSRYQGVNLHFSSAANKALFDAAPEKYLPEYGGFCANGIVYAIPAGGNPRHFLKLGERVFIFGGPSSRAAFQLDTQGNIALADRYWASEVRGSHPRWQAIKRMIFRVPHYKTDEQLAEEVLRARKP